MKGAEGSGARKGAVSGAGCPECLSLSAPLIPADRARQESSGITYWLGLPVQVLYMLRFQLPTFGIGTPSSFSVLELSLIKLAASAGSTSDSGTQKEKLSTGSPALCPWSWVPGPWRLIYRCLSPYERWPRVCSVLRASSCAHGVISRLS